MTQTFALSVQGMSCASCVGRVQRGLEGIAGIDNVAVNLASESASFRATPDNIAKVAEKLDDLG